MTYRQRALRRRPLASGLVVAAAAASAGIHGALVPVHLRASAGAGGGFLAATVLLAVLVVALTRQVESRALLLVTALVFAGLLVAYAVAVTTGVPVLQPGPEPVDGLALATKGLEAVGLVAALALAVPPHPSVDRRILT